MSPPLTRAPLRSPSPARAAAVFPPLPRQRPGTRCILQLRWQNSLCRFGSFPPLPFCLSACHRSLSGWSQELCPWLGCPSVVLSVAAVKVCRHRIAVTADPPAGSFPSTGYSRERFPLHVALSTDLSPLRAAAGSPFHSLPPLVLQTYSAKLPSGDQEPVPPEASEGAPEIRVR